MESRVMRETLKVKSCSPESASTEGVGLISFSM